MDNLNKNKIIGVICIVSALIIFIISTSLINDYKEIESNKGNLNQKIKEQINKNAKMNSELYNKELNKDLAEIKIYDLLSDYFYKINTKNLEKAYNMLNKEYKTDIGLSLLNFKNKYDIKDNLIFEIDKIKNISNNHYIIKVITYRDISNNSYKAKQYFTVFLDKKPSLIDIGVKNIEKINYINETKYLKVVCNKKYELIKGYMYTVDVFNKTPHTIQIKPDEDGIFGINKDKKYKITPKLINSFDEMYKIIPNPNKPKKFNLLFLDKIDTIKAQVGIIEDLNVINDLHKNKKETNTTIENLEKADFNLKYFNPYELDYKEIYFLNQN